MSEDRVQRIELPAPAEDQLLETFVALAGELNRSLREEANAMVERGLTTREEVDRVLGTL